MDPMPAAARRPVSLGRVMFDGTDAADGAIRLTTAVDELT